MKGGRTLKRVPIILTFFLGLFLLSTATILFAQEKMVIEPSTKVKFPESRPFLDQEAGVITQCAGTDVRKKFIVKVYAICFYVNVEELKTLFPDGFTGTEDDYQKLIEGSYHRGFVMRFVRGVGKGKIVGAYRDGLKKNWPGGEKTFDANQESVKAFLEASNHDIDKNAEMHIWIDNQGTIYVKHGTLPVQEIKDPDLAKVITAIWLGKKPVNKNMKKKLVKWLPKLLSGS